jgi:hypothetical protein
MRSFRAESLLPCHGSVDVLSDNQLNDLISIHTRKERRVKLFKTPQATENFYLDARNSTVIPRRSARVSLAPTPSFFPD